MESSATASGADKELMYLLQETQKVQAEETKLCVFKNTEDGYRWEGYGSRRLADGTPNRKSYYRCVNVRAANSCPAKKVLQEHPDNPDLVVVTYKGAHTHEPVRSSSSLHPILKLLHCPPPTINMGLFNLPTSSLGSAVAQEKRSRVFTVTEVSDAIQRNPDLLSAVGDFAITDNPDPLVDLISKFVPPETADHLRASSLKHGRSRPTDRFYNGLDEGKNRSAPASRTIPQQPYQSAVAGVLTDNLLARNLHMSQAQGASSSPTGLSMRYGSQGVAMETDDPQVSKARRPSPFKSTLGKRPSLECPEPVEEPAKRSAFDILADVAQLDMPNRSHVMADDHDRMQGLPGAARGPQQAFRAPPRTQADLTGLFLNADPVMEDEVPRDRGNGRAASADKGGSLPSLSSFFL